MFISHDGEHIIIILYEFTIDTKSFSGARRCVVLLYVKPHNVAEWYIYIYIYCRTYKSVAAPVMSIILLYDSNDSYNCYYYLGSIVFDWNNINSRNGFLPTGRLIDQFALAL